MFFRLSNQTSAGYRKFSIPSDDPARLVNVFVEKMPAPDHATIECFFVCAKVLLARMSDLFLTVKKHDERDV